MIQYSGSRSERQSHGKRQNHQGVLPYLSNEKTTVRCSIRQLDVKDGIYIAADSTGTSNKESPPLAGFFMAGYRPTDHSISQTHKGSAVHESQRLPSA